MGKGVRLTCRIVSVRRLTKSKGKAAATRGKEMLRGGRWQATVGGHKKACTKRTYQFLSVGRGLTSSWGEVSKIGGDFNGNVGRISVEKE